MFRKFGIFSCRFDGLDNARRTSTYFVAGSLFTSPKGTYNYDKHLVEGEEYTERPNNKTKITGIFRGQDPRREVGPKKTQPEKSGKPGKPRSTYNRAKTFEKLILRGSGQSGACRELSRELLERSRDAQELNLDVSRTPLRVPDALQDRP